MRSIALLQEKLYESKYRGVVSVEEYANSLAEVLLSADGNSDPVRPKIDATGVHREQELRTAIEVALHEHSTETRLAERERWFATTLECIGDAVLATDRAETITFMNAVAERLTGWSRSEALGRRLDEVFRLADASGNRIRNPVAHAIAKSFVVELPANTRLLTKGGNGIAIDDTRAPVVDDNGNVLGGVVVFRDATERRKLELRLSQAEMLASLGTMAAGMAHEINNALAAVVANVGFAMEAAERLSKKLLACDPEHEPFAKPLRGRLTEISEALKDANAGADRVRTVVHDFRKFSRVDAIPRTVLDLPEVLDLAAKMTEHRVRHHARLVKEYGTTPQIDANEGQMAQVFTNLLVNAAQAVGDGNAENQKIRVSTYTDGAGRAVVEIRDSGKGIPSDVLPRVFDPFFTTKPVGAGAGLGLSICHNIVTSMAGEITAESRHGEDTVFRVVLPPARRRPEPESPCSRVGDSGVGGRVLVIDDEPAVAHSIERMLRGHHHVTVATSGAEALATIASGRFFDVIFCDLMMPDVSGIDVYDGLVIANPEQARRMVFMTGGAFSPRSKDFLDHAANLRVSKPFAIETIRAIARDYVK